MFCMLLGNGCILGNLVKFRVVYRKRMGVAPTPYGDGKLLSRSRNKKGALNSTGARKFVPLVKVTRTGDIAAVGIDLSSRQSGYVGEVDA